MTAADRFIQRMNFAVEDDDMLDPEVDAAEAVKAEAQAAKAPKDGAQRVVDLTPDEAGEDGAKEDEETDVTSWREVVARTANQGFSTKSVASIQTVESRVSMLEISVKNGQDTTKKIEPKQDQILALQQQQQQHQQQQQPQNTMHSQPGVSALPGSSSDGPGAG